MAHWLIEHAQEKDAAIAESDPRFIELTKENKRLREERLSFAIECVDLWWLLTRVQIHMGDKRLPNELMRDIRKKLEDE